MKYMFFLSGDYLDLAKEEIISLFKIKNYKIADRLLLAGLKNSEREIKAACQRLALSKNVYRLLFECKARDLASLMKKFDWNSVYSGSFCLRANYLGCGNKKSVSGKSSEKACEKTGNYQKLSEKNLAGYVWDSLNNPKVNLKNPKTEINLFFIKDKAYCGLRVYGNNEDFESRKAHLRPFPHPGSLHPKVARALANISEIKENEILLDPFCGTGGFLIEAGLMKIKSIGCDISKNMAKGCRENLEYFNIKNSRIKIQNALTINDRFDYAVTDMPYGLNSNAYLQFNKNSIKIESNKINLKINRKNAIKNLGQFYLRFLKELRKTLKKKAVIVFPSFVDYRKLLKKSGFKMEKEFSIYVHRSLSRKIAKVS